MKRLAILLGVPLLCLGCAALKTAHDEVSMLCDVVGAQKDQHMAIAAEAARRGISFNDMFEIWHKVCEANSLLGAKGSVGSLRDAK